MSGLLGLEQEQTSAGTRGWRKPGIAAEIQAQLDGADASLTEDFRRLHPVSSLEQVMREHPNRWVALLPTRITDGLAVAAGRVVAEAADRAAIKERIVALRGANPRLALVAYFTGPSKHGPA